MNDNCNAINHISTSTNNTQTSHQSNYPINTDNKTIPNISHVTDNTSPDDIIFVVDARVPFTFTLVIPDVTAVVVLPPDEEFDELPEKNADTESEKLENIICTALVNESRFRRRPDDADTLNPTVNEQRGFCFVSNKQLI